MSDDDAYDYGSPKRSDYREPGICALCGGHEYHFDDCPTRRFE